MNAVIKGAKKGSGQARKAVIAPDSAQSKTFINILYGLSEGEVEGLANGLQSVYLEETPLHDSNGSPNFQNIVADFRNGTNDQEYIEGFPDISSETAVGVELQSGTPWVRAISNTDLDALRIRLKWGALRTTNEDNGDVTGVTIDYAIDLQTGGGAWNTVIDARISDKTSTNYERSHRIDLPKSDNGWQVRVRRITPNSTSEYVSDKMYVEAITEVIDLKLSYPNTALLGLRYDAETFSNVAKVAVDLKGIKVKVPSNYNPITRAYTGLWDGTFKRAYTNNPAWIYYDICTSKRYALGDRLTSSMVDKWSLYRLAQYCDQMVDDGKGGQEPRFTCNVYLQSTEDAYAILNKLAGVFRAITFWDGNSIVCDADIPQDTFFTYTRANVIDGLFEYSGSRARDRHTVAKVAWDNPKNHYKTEYVYVRDEAAIAKLGVRVVDIDAWGCTSEGQAQRAGLWALKSEQLETRTVSFKVGLDGHIPLPGKVIEIADELFAGRANGGRISAVSTNRRTITVDRDNVVCRAGDRLVVNGEDGIAQARTVSSVSGRNITVSSAFDSVAAQNVWVVDAQDLKTMKFRVMSITQNEKHQFSINAVQYESSKYDAIDHGAFIDERPISIINPTTQEPVSSVALTSENMVQQGISVATMLISWDQAKGATKYQVEWRKDDGAWIKLPITGANSVEVQGIYSGNYEARVTAISAFDVASLPTYSVLTSLSGKTGLPPALSNLTASGVLFGYKLKWNFPAIGALDTAYTEIEIATTANGANAAQLGLFAYPTTNHEIQGMQGNLTRYFRGRLIDRIGNIGPWSNWVSATTSADASAVLDILSGKITESQFHQNLQQKINQIDTIAGLDGDVGNLIEDIGAVQTQVNQLNQSLNNETQARLDAIEDLEDGLTQEIQHRQQGDAANLLALNNYKVSNDAALSNVQQAINVAVAENSSNAQAIQALDGRVTIAEDDASTAKTNAATALSQANIAVNEASSAASQVDQIRVVANEASDNADLAMQNSATALSTANGAANQSSANAQNIQAITVELGNKASAGALEQTNANVQQLEGRVSANTSKIDGVYAQVNPAMIGSNDELIGSTEGYAGAWSQLTAQIEGDQALSQRIDSTVAQINENATLIQSEALARANADSALGQRIDDLQAQVGNDLQQNLATIQQEMLVLANADSALSGRVDTVQSSTATAQQTAEQAIADAQSKANAAEQAAKAYAQAQAEAERLAAIAAASNDATAKANAAQQAAIAAAALDAKNKADAAELAAKQVANAAQQSADAAQQAAQQAANLAGNKGEVIYGSSAPAQDKRLSQNLWIDTTGGNNTPKRWNGSQWFAVTDKAATDAAAAASAAQATANEALGKANTATQNIASIQQIQGAFSDDLDAIAGRVDTYQRSLDGAIDSIEVINNIGNLEKLKHEIAKARLDGDIASLQAKSGVIDSAIDGFNAQILQLELKIDAEEDKGVDADLALIQQMRDQIDQLELAISDANLQKSAITSQINQIQSERNILESLVVTETKIKAQSTIKLDVGGRIYGYGLAVEDEEGGDVGNFVIRSDSFALASPYDTNNPGVEYYPFIFRNTPYTDPNTGTVFPVGAYMKSAFMDYASIDTAHIKDLAVKSAQIDDLAVTTAKIGDLQVDTLKIKDEAVTVPVGVHLSSPIAIPEVSGNIVDKTEDGQINKWIQDTPDLASITINRSGGKCRVDVGFSLDMFDVMVSQNGGINLIQGVGDTISLWCILMRNNVIVAKWNVGYPTRSYSSSTSVYQYTGSYTMPAFIDSPSVGQTTYKLKIAATTSRDNAQVVSWPNTSINRNLARNRAINIIELKK